MVRRRILAAGAVVALLSATAPATAGVVPEEAPKKASLTYSATIAGRSDDRSFVLLADGLPPTSAPQLVDSEGLRQVAVSVRADPEKTCPSRQVRSLGRGSDRWCVQLADLRVGNTFTGTLIGDRVEVTLTARARHPWYWPAPVAVLMFLLAVGIAWLAGHFAPDLIVARALTRETKNDQEIGGLKAWADGAQQRLGKPDTLARVRWAKRSGVAQLRAARADLGQAVADLPDCPLRSRAVAEVGRGAAVTIDELLSPGGARVDSPAEHLLTLVETARTGRAQFDEITAELIERITDPEEKRDAEKLVQSGHNLADGYLSEFTIEDYLTQLRDWAKLVAQKVPAPATDSTGPLVAAILGGGPLSPSAGPARRTGAMVASALRPVGDAVPAVLAGLALMAGAVITVLVSLYLPNPTFGSGKDYLALAATSFGSAQAAAVLALLLFLRGPADWRP